MLPRLKNHMLSWLDATLTALANGFIRWWTRVERSYIRGRCRGCRCG
jgi:hypothetical protein